jgi:hypothetical protein
VEVGCVQDVHQESRKSIAKAPAMCRNALAPKWLPTAVIQFA